MARAVPGETGRVANAALALACLGATLLLHYPGHLSFDAITIWYESRQPALFSQHPPALALLWHLLEYLLPGPGGFLIVQLGALWLAAWLLIARARPALPWALAFYAGLLLCPPVFAIAPQLGKDPLGAHLAVLAAVAVLPIGVLPRHRGIAPLGFAVSALAALVRYQFAIVTATLLLALLRRPRRPAAIAAAVVSVAATVLLVHLAIAATFAPPATGDVAKSLRKILVFDIAGALALDATATTPVFSNYGVDSAVLRQRAEQLYTPDAADPLWQPGGVFDLLEALPDAAIRAQWRATLAQAPLALLHHRALAFARVIGIGDVYGCHPITAGISARPPERVAALAADTFAPAWSTAVLTHRWFPAGTVLFRGWAYGAASVLVLFGWALGRLPFAAAMLAGGGLLYELSFAALPQACEVRYSYYLMLTALFAVALSIFHAMSARRL